MNEDTHKEEELHQNDLVGIKLITANNNLALNLKAINSIQIKKCLFIVEQFFYPVHKGVSF